MGKQLIIVIIVRFLNVGWQLMSFWLRNPTIICIFDRWRCVGQRKMSSYYRNGDRGGYKWKLYLGIDPVL